MLKSEIINGTYRKVDLLRVLFVMIIALLVGFTGCKNPSPKVTITSPPEPLRGETSFEILKDPNAPKRELEENQSYQQPKAIGKLSMPIYPKAPLDNKVGEVSVAARIVIDVNGKVRKIADSPLISSTPSVYLKDFQKAVEEAMQSWEFEPAEIQQLEDGKDLNGDGKPDYKRVISSQKVPVYLDLRFDFTIVEGRGRVRANTTSPSKKP
jgi:hypothetical protein